MKHLIRSSLLGLGLATALAGASQAACYADYKAKRGDPLRLHYGVMQIHGTCTRADAAREAQARLAENGWTLLTVVSVFGEAGLSERRASAGPYFLRF